MRRMLVVLILALVSSGVSAQTLIYIEPTDDGFQTYLTAAMHKKGVPVSITTNRDLASLTLTTAQIEIEKQSTGSKVVKCLFAYCGGIEDKASTSVTLITNEGTIVWSYSVNKGRGAKNRQSMAEAIAKHLKDEYFDARRAAVSAPSGAATPVPATPAASAAAPRTPAATAPAAAPSVPAVPAAPSVVPAAPAAAVAPSTPVAASTAAKPVPPIAEAKKPVAPSSDPVAGRQALDAATRSEIAQDWPLALQQYEKARALDPSMSVVIDAAIARVKASFGSDGDDAFRRARQYDAVGRVDDAIVWYERAVEKLHDTDANKRIAEERLVALKARR